ncbi:ABC transporter ATP-binding protein [Coraliomargarita parva]|uniref:ABC transporter ATP-binding protein n=1 Tax=Coraliomargarita parva TaxID=3014050 RepID=UPI0022B5A967|nr:ABC transporter ATP-binding protein [Coraliomargarita parva]
MTSEPKEKKRSDLEICFRVLKEVKPYRWGLAGFLFVSLLAAPIALLTPLPLKIAIDSGLGETPLPDWVGLLTPDFLTETPTGILILSGILVIGIVFLTQVQWAVDYMMRTMLAEKIVLDFRAKLFRHVQRLSFSFHDRKGSADSTYRIQWDARAMHWVLIDGMIPLAASVFSLVAMLYVTFSLNWRLGLVSVLVSPFVLGITHLFRPMLRENAKRQKNLESEAFSVIPETLGALRVVKAFGQEDREQGRFVNQSRKSLTSRMRFTAIECSMGMTLGMTTAVGTALVLFIGASQVLNGTLKVGELLLIMSYTAQLYTPLKAMSKQVGVLQTQFASAERALALLEEPNEVVERPHAKEISKARGEISFKKVAFHYTDCPEVFSGVTLKIPAGTKVGIAGRTGSGKTTLISLLMRFYDVTSGEIQLDGQDIRDYRIPDLRRQFGIVLQDPVLFAESIAENIRYGKPEATDEEVFAAAQAANAHDFVSKLPDGYQTRVGERGMRLSGGERQRISLARAFLMDAPILVLDEPTSAVDVKTEQLIMDALNRLMEGRTTFMIAHRLSTLENCDIAVTLEDGQLRERSVSSVM